jgi:uncharacterized protein YozE (UPF0346 family)
LLSTYDFVEASWFDVGSATLINLLFDKSTFPSQDKLFIFVGTTIELNLLSTYILFEASKLSTGFDTFINLLFDKSTFPSQDNEFNFLLSTYDVKFVLTVSNYDLLTASLLDTPLAKDVIL